MHRPNQHESLWIATSARTSYAPLRADVTVDVAVVGGGITGLTAALRLVEEGRRVAVLDMHGIAAGETGHTTAHLTEVVDGRYTTINTDFGVEGGRLVGESSRQAIDWIERTTAALSIACGFERVPGFLYTEREDDVAMLREEVEQASRAGVGAKFTRDVPLAFPTRGALRVERQAQFHVREYLLPIAARIAERGGLIFENTRAESVDDGEPCRVVTEHGIVTAGAVIVAANVPMNRVALITKLPAYRSYALGVRIAGDAPRGLFWDTDDPYHYTRTQRLQDGDVVIIGGEDHKTGMEKDTERRYEALADYARSRFAVERIEYSWSGQIIEPVDGLPYIGLNTASRHVYVATGFSGNGMTYGTLAGLITADLVLGRSNPYAELYDATRVKPLAAAKDYVTENVDFPTHLVKDRLTKHNVESRDPAGVSPGTGRIVAIDGRKYAVYRDEQGTAHAFSPVCPHMGCDVAWNPAERTWDCPCHGSRFEATGDVINGPAVTPLDPVELPQHTR
jgi:glycine/D-amino acid oxidase-like deaminating enzyme/nitrite reductase/ring-hydroxylating ferredoxin subunit